MTTYNRLDFTRQSIDSIHRNNGYPFTLTVFDNGSTDGTRQFLESELLAGRIDRLFTAQENHGVAKAANVGMYADQTAEYYLKIDNDIVIQKPNWLRDMVAVADKFPQIGALAYNFEQASYPIRDFAGTPLRIKPEGNIGGACILLPRRTIELLGAWNEDFGLYGEEDPDYCYRLTKAGLIFAYMEDENVGLHLPSGRAATIDPQTLEARDEMEDSLHRDYRVWKDGQRRQNVQSGAFHRTMLAYDTGQRPIKFDSEFAKDYIAANPGMATVVPAAPNRKSVDIVIPVYNKLDLTRACLDAVGKTMPKDVDVTVFVVDNGSTDGTREFLERAAAADSWLRIIRNETNLGFAHATNQGIAAGSSEFVLMLNNDTVPLGNWLGEMLAEAAADEKIGIVGALLLYPDGVTIQHAGVDIAEFDGKLMPFHRDKLRKFKYVPEARQSRDCPMVTAACLLARRSMIDEIGALDEAFINSYEDVDFNFRAAQSGYRIRYCASATVIHHESVSANRHDHDRENMELMNSRWRGTVRPDPTALPRLFEMWYHEELAKNPNDLRHRKLLKDLQYSLGRSDDEIGEFDRKDKPIPAEHERITDKEKLAEIRRKVLAKCDDSQSEVDISIIVPVHNNLEFTQKCIKSVCDRTRSKFEIIVVDNASTDGTPEYLCAEQVIRGNIRVITNKTNENFARANNSAAAIANGKYMVFMNNDIETLDGWDTALVSEFAADKRVGVQGAKLLYPNGTVQHAGIVRGNLGAGRDGHLHIYLTAYEDLPCVNQKREMPMVTGALLAIRSELFSEVGGFDENYEFGHEDLDLCLATAKHGYKVVYNPSICAIHYEAQTKRLEGLERFERFSDGSNENLDAKNERYFRTKWADSLVNNADEYYFRDGMLALVSDAQVRNSFLLRVQTVIKAIDELASTGRHGAAQELHKALFGRNAEEMSNNINRELALISIRALDAAEAILGRKPESIEAPKREPVARAAFEPIAPSAERKPKVLFTMYGWDESGGGTTFPRSIALELVRRGYEVAVFYANLRQDAAEAPYSIARDTVGGVQLFGLYNRPAVFIDPDNPEREVFDGMVTMRFIEVLEEFAPDVVHFHNFHGLTLALAEIVWERGIPSAYTPHNYHLIDPNLYMFNSDLSLWPRADMLACSEAVARNPKKRGFYEERRNTTLAMLNEYFSVTLAVSSRQRELLIEHGAEPDKIAVLHQAHSMTDKLWASAKLAGEANRPISRPIRFGYIGGVMAQKGVHAIAICAAAFPAALAEFHIYGFSGGQYLEQLTSFDKQGRLVFHGEYKPEDMEQIASEIDVAILPTLWEDCAPLVLLELRAMRLPVIASRIGGVPDFVEEGHSGWLYQYNDFQELIQKMSYCIENPGEIQRMRAALRQNHSFGRYIDRLTGVYSKLWKNGKIETKDVELHVDETAFDSEPDNDDQKEVQEVSHSYVAYWQREFEGFMLERGLVLKGFGLQIEESGRLEFALEAEEIKNDEESDDDYIESVFGNELIIESTEVETLEVDKAEIIDSTEIIENNKDPESTMDADKNLFAGFDFSEPEAAKTAPEPDCEKELNVVWEGSQFVYHSLALINREQCSNLIDSGVVELTIVPYEQDNFSPMGNAKYERLLEYDIRTKIQPTEEIRSLPYVWIRHQWPPKKDEPRGAKWIINQPWEFSQLRKDFVDLFNQADEVWTPSNFTKQAMLDSGVAFDKVHVIPNGIDPALFTPSGKRLNIPTTKRFKILYVGGTIYRKGIDILLTAYAKMFTRKDDVCLVIKDMGGETFYKGMTAKDYIKQMQENPDAPEVCYLDENVSEQEMAALYRACDIFASPYRGEGFSLPTLEAMASGLPVVVTAGGATDDFVTDECGWRIPSTKKSVGETVDGYEMAGETFMLEPDGDELGNVLKNAYQSPSDLVIKGIRAARIARTQWTWRRATMKVLERLDALYAKNMAEKAASRLSGVEDGPIVLDKAEDAFYERNYRLAAQLYQEAIDTEELTTKYHCHAISRLAMISLQKGNLSAAEELARQAIAINPICPDPNYLIAKIHSERKEWPESLDAFSELMNQWPSKKFNTTIGIALDDLLSGTAEGVFFTGDEENAFKLFSEALRQNPNNAEACLGTARCFSVGGDEASARNMVDWALKLQPDYTEARDFLAELDGRGNLFSGM